MEERKKEKSCGIVVFDDNNRVLIVKQCKGHYGFPKGHVEEGETEEETAIREVKEETNCDAKIIDGFRFKYSYIVRKDNGEERDKDVILFVGRPITKDLKPQEGEATDVFFAPIKEAYAILQDFPNVVNALKEAVEFMDKENKNDRN